MSDHRFTRRRALGYTAATGIATALGLNASPALAAPISGTALTRAFDQAADRYGVPHELLVALAYAETKLDNHDGQPSASGAYGLTALTENPSVHNLTDAARLTGTDPERLKRDDEANIAGTAALLAARADRLGLTAADRRRLETWHPVLAGHPGGDAYAGMLYADAVYDALAGGVRSGGLQMVATATEPDRRAAVAAAAGPASALAASDLSGESFFLAANPGNYRAQNRPDDYPITNIIIHTVEGSFSSCINWFRNPASGVSAHFVIRSSDGAACQMVRHKDVAFHAGVRWWNERSIGIEHEGYLSQASWFTDTLYRSSAYITRALCRRYGIPMNRDRIRGHSEVPGADHGDPGRLWNWSRYMAYVTGARQNPWQWTALPAGTGLTAAKTLDDAPAWFRAPVPERGNYNVEVKFPAAATNSPAAAYLINTRTGPKTVWVDQTSSGSQWQSIGHFALSAGTKNVVGISRDASAAGTVSVGEVRLTEV